MGHVPYPHLKGTTQEILKEAVFTEQIIMAPYEYHHSITENTDNRYGNI